MKAKKIVNLLFLGPQGSGKGTQAKLLAEKYHMRHLSSGEVLRETAKKSTPLGRFLKRQLATGVLTPISKLMEVFEDYIRTIPAKTSLILDGFARQITETKIILRRLKKIGRSIDAVVLINISSRETLIRLSKRGQCDKCKRIYILSGKIRVGSTCPVCGGRIYQREDDKPAAITKRLAAYNKRTMPVVRFFQAKGLLIKIDGEQPVPKVHQDMVQSLRKRSVIN